MNKRKVRRLKKELIEKLGRSPTVSEFRAYKKRGEDIAYKPGRHEITDEKSIFINDLDKPRGTEELGEMEEPEGPKL